MMENSSRLSGFFQLGQDERLDLLKSRCALDDATIQTLKDSSALPFDLVNRLVENAIGGFTVPLGIATNMIIDGQDILIPMATEESSVIAAVGNTAKQCRDTGGFFTSLSSTEMIAQVQIINLTDP